MQQSGSEGGNRTRVIRRMKPGWRLSSLPRYFTSAQMTAFADFRTRLLNLRLIHFLTPGFQPQKLFQRVRASYSAPLIIFSLCPIIMFGGG